MPEVVQHRGVKLVPIGYGERANVLDADTVADLAAAIETADSDGTVVLLLRGTGRHFSAGFDFRDIEKVDAGSVRDRFLSIQDVLEKLRTAKVVTAAYVNGVAAGAAADVVAACDLRAGDADARFLFPGFHFGIALGSQRLSELVGAATAMEWIMTMKWVESKEAEAAGLVHRVTGYADWVEWLQTLADGAGDMQSTDLERLVQLLRLQSSDTGRSHLAASLREPDLIERMRTYWRQHEKAGR